MVFDTDAVKQVVRPYIGYYLVKAGCVGEILQYKSDVHSCSVFIDCGSGEITVKLDEEYRGKTSASKKSENYNTIHEIFEDPRLLFVEEVVKPKKKPAKEEKDEEPLKFSISEFRHTSFPKPLASTSSRPSLRPMLDLGGDLGGDLGSFGPPVPVLPPPKEQTRVEKQKAAVEARRIQREKEEAEKEGTFKKPVSHQDILAMDYLYKTKTKSELNFLKRQLDKEKETDQTEKKAKLSHKQNIDKYNAYLAAIPEQNELRRINSSKF